MRWSVGDAVAGVHESLIGTFRTWRNVRLESAMRAKANTEWNGVDQGDVCAASYLPTK